MAASYNPYEAPGASGYGAPRQTGSNETITATMVEHMRAARPWVRLLSVLCFVGGGFMVLGAMLLFLGGLAGLATSSRHGSSGIAEAIAGPIGGFMYLMLAGVYLLPGVLMHRFANSIDSFVMTQSSYTLEDALDKSRAYWKTCGIMALVVLGFFILTFVGTLFLGIAVGLAGKP